MENHAGIWFQKCKGIQSKMNQLSFIDMLSLLFKSLFTEQ